MLIGNLTRDPEVRYTANGTAVASFSIATNKTWKDASGEQQESTQYHNIVAWGKMAEICQQLLTKGLKVYIEGELNNRSWQDEKSGETKYRTEVKADNMILLSGKGNGGTSVSSGSDDQGAGDDPLGVMSDDSNTAGSGSSDSLADDDLPF